MSSPAGLSGYMKNAFIFIARLAGPENAFVARDFNLAPFMNTKFTLKRRKKEHLFFLCWQR